MADVRVVVAVVDAVVELVEMVELGAVDEMAGVVAVVVSTTIYEACSTSMRVFALDGHAKSIDFK